MVVRIVSDKQPAPAAEPALDYEDLFVGNQLCLAMYNATNRITHAYDSVIEPLGLTYPQLVCLMALWERSPQTVTMISRSLDMGKGAITTLVLRLQAKGLLVRERDLVDERCFSLRITQKGLALREPLREARLKLACALALPPDEIVGMKHQLNRMHRRMVDAA